MLTPMLCSLHANCTVLVIVGPYQLQCLTVPHVLDSPVHRCTLLLCWLQKAEDILTPEGVMEVWLLEAQHVPKMDFFGSGQPYGK